MLGFGCFFLVVLFVFETFCYAAQASLEHVASLLFLLLSAETQTDSRGRLISKC